MVDKGNQVPLKISNNSPRKKKMHLANKRLRNRTQNYKSSCIHKKIIPNLTDSEVLDVCVVRFGPKANMCKEHVKL